MGAPLTGTGAVLVLDSFSDGAFEIGTPVGLPESTLNPITSDIVAVRQAAGNGRRPWVASVDAAAGLFTYTVALESQPLNTFVLAYQAAAQTFSLLGYSAFRLTVVDVVGSGRLYAALEGAPGADFSLLLDRPGEYVFPFANMDGHPPLDELRITSFWFFPETSDFSITIDQIAVVPEPASLVLILTGVGGILLLRRRPQAAGGISVR